MACFIFPIGLLPINVTVPLMNAAINALLAYNEYEIYSDHRTRLDILTDKNMALATRIDDANKELWDLRDELYDLVDKNEVECEPCCGDAMYEVFSINARAMHTYQRLSESLHYSQLGARASFMVQALSGLPASFESAASQLHNQAALCANMKEDHVRGVTSSGFRGEMPSSAILAQVAQTNADTMNDSAMYMSHFINEAFQSIGQQLGYNRRQNNAGNFDVGNNPRVIDTQVGSGVLPAQQTQLQYNSPVSVYNNNGGRKNG